MGLFAGKSHHGLVIFIARELHRFHAFVVYAQHVNDEQVALFNDSGMNIYSNHAHVDYYMVF